MVAKVDNEYEWEDEGHEALWVLAVDPGLNSCGYALFHTPTMQLIRVGIAKPPRHASLGLRMQTIVDDLHDCLSGRQVITGIQEKYIINLIDLRLVVEMPHYQEGSAKGSFGWKTGDLQKLTLLVGFLVGHNWGAVTLATPRDWKGQLPKDVVIRRITKRLGAAACNRLNIQKDAWDAVGIGLWYLTGKV